MAGIVRADTARLNTIKSQDSDVTAALIDGSGYLDIAQGILGKNSIYAWAANGTNTVATATATVVQLSTTNYASNGITISNHRFTVSKTGRYLLAGTISGSGTGSAGYTPITYFYKNGSTLNSHAGIRYYAGSCTLDWPMHMTIAYITDTTDYYQLACWQNSGNTFTINGGSFFMLRVGE